MNPLTNVKNISKLSHRELEMGIDVKNSWHQMYKDSAWIFIGGLHYDLSEGDIIAVFSQYGEIVNINLVRDRKTAKSRGFAFLCYEDQRSTILAVDNFNGIKLLERILRVDHVEEYRIPKEFENWTPELLQLHNEGCAPKPIPMVSAAPDPPKSPGLQESKKPKSKKRKSSPEDKQHSKRHKKSKHKHKKKSKHH